MVIESKQPLPHMIASCHTYMDETTSENLSSLCQKYRSKLDQFMIINSGEGDHSCANVVKSEAWQDLADEHYSFSIFSVLQFDPEIQQEILELKRPDKRLEPACKVLNLI